MPKSPSTIPSIASVEASWIITKGEMCGHYVYQGIADTISWISHSRVLRFSLRCVDGDEEDLEVNLRLTVNGVTFKYDTSDGVESVVMERFDGPTGILLYHRTQREIINIALRPKPGKKGR